MLKETLDQMYLRKVGRRRDEIAAYLYSNVTQISGVTLWETPNCEKYDDAVRAEGYKPINVGESWGGNGLSGWFKVRFTVPKEHAGKPFAVLINIGFEGCVFMNGTPYHGVDRFHEEVLLSESAEAGKEYELIVEAMSGEFWQNQTEPAVFKRAEIATINREVNQYWYALGFLMQLAETLPEKSVRRARLIRGLNESVNLFDFDNTDEASLCESANRAYSALLPLLEKKAADTSLALTCTGHAHIDTAWLWPYSETIRKCSRTFSTVLRYLEQYPDYQFSQSQPQLYEFTREYYPELYEEIKKWAKTGRWEPIGCMWVEADTNVPSGESLVRQVLYGKRFFSEEFGVDTDTLWLPDVFGYSGSLPQILKKAGVDYFTTIKLVWGNQFNQIPYSSFWWQGIDGTRVLTHMPPHGDYNTLVAPALLRKAEDEYKEKDRSDYALYQYGWGDGGGGPAKNHLENLKLAKDLEGLPKCVQRPAKEFFADLSKEAATFPTWRGELYFELHRGTYTTQAKTKRYNRKAEFALRDAEIFEATAMLLDKTYSAASFADSWKLILKNQFHDVIPGSSVKEVYQDTDRDYSEVFRVTSDAISNTTRKISERIRISGEGEPVAVFNTLSWDRVALAEVTPTRAGSRFVVDQNGTPVPSQLTADGRLIFLASVPAMGYATYKVMAKGEQAKSSELTVSPTLLENRFFRIELDDQGMITSLFDKRFAREVVPEGAKANLFRLFEDKPLDYGAWDIDFFYTEVGEDITSCESIEVAELGPVYGALKVVRRFGKSKLEQRIVIYSDTPRIDFATEVDWHEHLKVLKVAFPVTVNSPTARYEIQFGNVDRPTHSSTSWDFAKFEVCGHKWADLSEGGFGVSLMNDCKYGYDIRENVMRLTLLRASVEPDPTADRGHHTFTYSLYPHAGDYAEGGTVRAGYELNVPVITEFCGTGDGDLPADMSLLRVDADHVVLDSIKRAEDDNSIILRFYEAHNKRGRVNVTTDLAVTAAIECNLMENDLGKVSLNEGVISFDVLPFEIKTIRISVS